MWMLVSCIFISSHFNLKFVAFQTYTCPFSPLPLSDSNYVCEVCMIGQLCFIFLSFCVFWPVVCDGATPTHKCSVLWLFFMDCVLFKGVDQHFPAGWIVRTAHATQHGLNLIHFKRFDYWMVYILLQHLVYLQKMYVSEFRQ